MRENQIGLVEIVSAAFRHKRLLLGLFFLIVGGTIVYCLVVPKQYASAMKILVLEARPPELLTTSNTAAPAPTVSESPDVITSRMTSEVELLSDTDLMEHLVIYRGTLVPSDPAPAPGSKAMGLAIRKMTSRFDILPVKGANVIDISYTDISPELAQKMLKELARAFIQMHVRFSRPEESTTFFTDQADEASRNLQSVEDKLANFRLENHFVDLEREKSSVDASLDSVRQLILTDEAQVQSVSSQIVSLDKELRKLDKRVVTTVTTTPTPIGVQTLVANLTDLKNRRISLLERFKPTDRLVVEIDAQIANTQQALDMIRRDSASTSTDNNPTAVLLFQQLESLVVQQSGLDKSLDFLREQERSFEERRDQLVRITPMNDQLSNQLAELKGISQSIASKRDSAVLEDLLDKGDFGNVAVAQPPTYSRLHTKPKIVLYTLLSLFTDLFLSAALLFILETRRASILTSSDIRQISSIPVLGTIPDSKAYQMVLAGQS
jgi:uncharacterized protein involved in exopolysaccharide biosynthesis